MLVDTWLPAQCDHVDDPRFGTLTQMSFYIAHRLGSISLRPHKLLD
jgi:hypothetical protein